MLRTGVREACGNLVAPFQCGPSSLRGILEELFEPGADHAVICRRTEDDRAARFERCPINAISDREQFYFSSMDLPNPFRYGLGHARGVAVTTVIHD